MVDKYVSEKNAINKGFYCIIQCGLTFSSQLKKKQQTFINKRGKLLR